MLGFFKSENAYKSKSKEAPKLLLTFSKVVIFMHENQLKRYKKIMYTNSVEFFISKWDLLC